MNISAIFVHRFQFFVELRYLHLIFYFIDSLKRRFKLFAESLSSNFEIFNRSSFNKTNQLVISMYIVTYIVKLSKNIYKWKSNHLLVKIVKFFIEILGMRGIFHFRIERVCSFFCILCSEMFGRRLRNKGTSPSSICASIGM